MENLPVRTMAEVYGGDVSARFAALRAQLPEGCAARYFTAPGRSELGGNHTDHQQGCVLACAVSLDAIAAAAPNGTQLVHVRSEGYPALTVSLDLLDPQPEETGSSAALIRGIAARFVQLGYAVGGFDAAISSQVPGGSGLSSSAAYEVLIGAVFDGLFNSGSVPPAVLAQVGQWAENHYFGKPCGLMDQTACAVGSAITIDFKDPANPVVGTAKFDLATHNFALCISDTKGSHADLTDDYAAIRREMESVAEQFGKPVLREVDEQEFLKAIPSLRSKVGDRAVVRAIHFYNDCRRAADLCAAIRDDRFEEFLQLVIEGGHSSFEFNQNAYSKIGRAHV